MGFPSAPMIQGLVQSRVLIPSQPDRVDSGRHAWMLSAVLRDRLKGRYQRQRWSFSVD